MVDGLRNNRGVKKLSLFSIYLLSLSMVSAHAAPLYAFPVSDCAVKYVRAHHDYPATDIQAKKGCAVVATTNGIIDFVATKDIWNGKTNLGQDRGGLAIAIIGDDGVRYYGSHLSKIEQGIAVGVRVVTGQKIGEVGNSGDAKGIAPHLHFGISWPTTPDDWKVRRGKVSPFNYLNAWKAGTDKSPYAEVEKAKKSGK